MDSNKLSGDDLTSLVPLADTNDFTSLGHAMLSELIADLPPPSQEIEDRLEFLARVASTLSIDDDSVSFSRSCYANAIARSSSKNFSLERSLNRLEHAESELQAHLASVRHELQLIQKWERTMEHENETGDSAATLERRREALLKKAKEYHEELDALLAEMRGAPQITVTQFNKQQEINKRKERELKAKHAKIRAFQGLPPNLELARNELRNAQGEQMKLVQLRERLLGRMAESVT